LTFDFGTVSEEVFSDFAVIKNKTPWNIAYTDEHYGFGAKWENNNVKV